MNEETYRRWDITAKFIAPVITVAGILVGIWQFSAGQAAQSQRQREQTAENDKLDFKRRIWEKQLSVYSRINNVVGRIAASRYKNDKEKFAKDVDEFNSIYWGDFIYVKDAAVERTIIDFHKEIDDFLQGASDEDRLKQRAYDLINACRESSKNNWFE